MDESELSIAMDRRTRKRLATRQVISDVATKLFIARGFDNVTVDEIAQAADVARKTVFNHFARKEDMFFDLDEQVRNDLKAALSARAHGPSLLDSLQEFAHQAIRDERPYVSFHPGNEIFVDTVLASEPLKARARAIRDEFTGLLAGMFSKAAHDAQDDPDANLAASLFVSSCVAAATQAHRLFRKTGDAEQAKSLFLKMIDQGVRGIKVAMEGSPLA